MRSISSKPVRFAVLGLFALAPCLASAATVADLQKQVDSYVSATMETDVDSLLSSYGSMNITQAYTLNSPTLDGNGDPTWTKLNFDDTSASQLLGYASNMCAAQVTYSQLVAKGVKVDQAKFNDISSKFCKLVQAAAQLKNRYDKFQAIRTSGLVLVSKSKSQSHDFKGHHRTFGGGVSLVYYPDIMNTLQNGFSQDGQLDYRSWLKWSDDQPVTLDFIKRIRDMNNNGKNANNCEGIQVPLVTGSVDLKLFIDIQDVTASKVTIRNCVRAHYDGETRSHNFPNFTVDAPFGYLYELEEMKDSAKAKMVDKVKDKVSSMIGINQQMVTLLKSL